MGPTASRSIYKGVILSMLIDNWLWHKQMGFPRADLKMIIYRLDISYTWYLLRYTPQIR